MQASDHFNGKIFSNPVPTTVMKPGAFGRVMRKFFQKQPNREPRLPPGPFHTNASVFEELAEELLRVTWLGHSSLLIESGGKRLLTDPVWYDRVSPFKYLGPKRFFQNPLSLQDIPKVDFILLSHDHYDHLDKQSILQLGKRGVPVITFLGVGQRLINWGLKKELVTELDWWQSVELGKNFTITAAPARHFSGRWLHDRFKTLWGSFAVRNSFHSIFFGADSGYFDGFKTIGERLGPFDLAMLEIGAYDEEWESIHMGPENAVKASLELQTKLLLPIHWGTFNLAMHPWTEPIERLLKAAAAKELSLLLPAPGEPVRVTADAYINHWWEKYM
jgi:L-ascorbate metabolism protein UlaG (beta-lactamase superfamily)